MFRETPLTACSMLINLPLFFLWNKDNNNFVWLKMGKWVTKCSVNILAPWTPGVSRKQSLQPNGMYTVDEEKGVGLLSGPLRWIKEWVLVTCGGLWLDLVFSSVFPYFNLRPLCLRPEPLWTLNTHVTSHAHSYVKFGLFRLHQFTECDHNRFSLHNISFKVK